MSRLVAPGGSRLARPGLRPPASGLNQHSSTQNHSKTSPAHSLGGGGPRAPSTASKDTVDSGSSTPVPSFDCGDRVVAGGTKQGTVAFVGTTQFARGMWVGVVLDTPEGKNNGSVNGVSYFQCEPNFGLFSKPEKLVLLKRAPASKQPTSSAPPLAKLVSPTSSEPSSQLKIGDLVLVDGIKTGKVAFVGPTQFAKGGVWIGVHLDEPEGKNDGSVNGVSYFKCPPLHGVFTRPNKVSLQPQSQQQPRPSPNMPRPVGVGLSPIITPEEMKVKASQMKPGDRVLVNGNKEGTLKFIGSTHFAKGIWVGIELDTPQGKNDGAVSGKRYFQCEPLFGLFAPLPKVEKIADAEIPFPTHSGRRPSGSSSVSSVSSINSMSKARQLQYQSADSKAGPPSPNAMNPLVSVNSSDNLSHILFEKDHHIATLQSGLDQSEQEKMKLSEQLTDYKRQVDDLNFRLEELSVISGDQLEKVAMKDDSEIEDLKQELLIEKERNEPLQRELTDLRLQLQTLNSQLENNNSSKEMTSEIVKKHENTIRDLESSNSSLRDEINRFRHELNSAESDFRTTEVAASNIRTELETNKLQLQETLDLCSQQENLLEEKVKELETIDEDNRNLRKEIERMVNERKQLIAIQEQVSKERDNALRQLEDLRSHSQTVTVKQSQLATERLDLLKERDQARAELRDNLVFLENLSNERDRLKQQLDELLRSREEAHGKTVEFSLQLDTTQNELGQAQLEIDRLKREMTMLTDDKDGDKLVYEQKLDLVEATCLDLKERLNRANEDRDSALVQAQTLSDRLTKAEDSVDKLKDNLVAAHNQILMLEEQLEDLKLSYEKLLQENNFETGSIQQQIDELQEMLELRERELEEAREKIVLLEEELVVLQSSGSGMENDQRLVELEEEKLTLEEKLIELEEKLHQLKVNKVSDNSNTAGRVDASLLEEKEKEISFLNSVIVDQKTKIETLEALNGLGGDPTVTGYLDSSEDDILGSQLPPPRVFCDICDEFDQHDTADCPLQAQNLDESINTQYHAHRSHERPYCENCEVFGHWTDECEYEETY